MDSQKFGLARLGGSQKTVKLIGGFHHGSLAAVGDELKLKEVGLSSNPKSPTQHHIWDNYAEELHWRGFGFQQMAGKVS